jgi:hypothetical protein
MRKVKIINCWHSLRMHLILDFLVLYILLVFQELLECFVDCVQKVHCVQVHAWFDALE